jgi:hypothetical protein
MKRIILDAIQRHPLETALVAALGAVAFIWPRIDTTNLPITENCTILTATPTVSKALDKAMSRPEVTGPQSPEAAVRLGQLLTSSATGSQIALCSIPGIEVVSAKADNSLTYTVTWEGDDAQTLEILGPSELRPLMLNGTDS